MIPATIPRWSRFVTFISVLIPASSFCSCALPLVNYFTLPLRAECGLKIAAIAIVNNAIVLTRNTSDFGQIANLQIEDWTQ